MSTAPTRPEALPVVPDALPAVLKAAPCWLVWRYVQDVDPQTGEVDWDKPPRNARTDGLASSTNPATWNPYEVALAAYERGNLDGLGFALQRKPGDDGPDLVAIDLDKCRDPSTGEIDGWAREVIRVLSTYTEVSPSGRGIRLFLLGRLPPHGRKRGKFECYETGRYVTVTGQRLQGTPQDVEERQEQLLRIHHSFFGDGPKAQAKPTGGGTPANADDAEIVRRAGEAKNGAKFRALWDGDPSGFGSHSEADLALVSYLAFWCGPDEQRIADLFAQSGLARSKWQREDYRQRTISKALQGRGPNDFYDWDRRGNSGATRNGDGRHGEGAHGDAREGDGGGDPPGEPPQQDHRFRWQPIDSATFARGNYRPRWLVKRLFICGQPFVFGGPQKAMKTSLLVDLAISLGSRTPFLGTFDVYERCKVAVISGESGEFALQETALRICRARGIDLADVDCSWQFRLPQMGSLADLAEVARGLKQDRVDVVLIDPLYLALLTGEAARGKEASNLFDTGPLLMEAGRMCLTAGATPGLAHHTTKPYAKQREPLELSDLAFSGIAEYARAWLLVNRREAFEPGSGEHKLWVAAGGSCGQSGLWSVDVSEGQLRDDFSGRTWDVRVAPAREARAAEQGAKQGERERREAMADRDDETKVLQAIDRLDPDRRGVVFTHLRAESRLSGDRTRRACRRLVEAEILDEVAVTITAGKGATRTAEGYRRHHPDHPNPDDPSR